MALATLLADAATLQTAAIAGVLLFLTARSIYRLFLHPLSHIPGPVVARISSLWLYYHAYVGDEATAIHALHVQHGACVRVSPHEVDIADPDAVPPIYVLRGGFPKAPCYRNFDVDGHPTLFSQTDPAARAPRAKAVLPLFATAAIRANIVAIAACADRFVERLAWEKAQSQKAGGRVNVLNAARALAIDAVSTHLFDRSYDGTAEQSQRLSASAFVDAFVAVGRFFYLPTPVFVWLEWLSAAVMADEQTATSMRVVDQFVADLVAQMPDGADSYPGRLRRAGIADDEIKAQCKDLMFAGTDSSGMNLATIVRQLVLHPEIYQRLRDEVTAAETAPADLPSLPYLAAVVKEGTRLSMANPTRLPHVVPAGGWTFKGVFFPAGSIVGCSARELHYDRRAFPAPDVFRPERWLVGDADTKNSTNDAADRDRMARAYFAFGAGSRACIARNLAVMELLTATYSVVRSGVLDGARVGQDRVELIEWFNSKVKGERIDLIWNAGL